MGNCYSNGYCVKEKGKGNEAQEFVLGPDIIQIRETSTPFKKASDSDDSKAHFSNMGQILDNDASVTKFQSVIHDESRVDHLGSDRGIIADEHGVGVELPDSGLVEHEVIMQVVDPDQVIVVDAGALTEIVEEDGLHPQEIIP